MNNENMLPMYPDIEIEKIRRPKRFYAIPLLGFFIRLLLVLPVFLEISLLSIVIFYMSILNSFNIFLKGRYWKLAYDINLGKMKLETNVSYFLFGLTDIYPGFSLVTTPDYSLKISYNKSPNRFLATPLLGLFIRTLLLLPYLFYSHILTMAAVLAVLVSWIPVLWKRRYPETTFEIVRDSIRINQAIFAYSLGMSDRYPSWWISFNHKPLKILLLALATILTIIWFNISWHRNYQQPRHYQQNLFSTTQIALHSTY